ncbi:MAG: arsenic resistance N-acetyltransferase ArsN2 [Bacteroidota bacterium]|nr:arsenic resistance N-acetyltransferase ArsN2 [Bacteroidota bacterium]
MDTIEFKKLSEKNLPRVVALLTASNLPASDVRLEKQNFIVAELNSEIVGSIALERKGKNGLLRSFAVKESCRNRKIGEQLYREMVSQAKDHGMDQLYLLTTTADVYFKKLGWQIVTRDEVPVDIRATSEFSSVCPSTSICMMYQL